MSHENETTSSKKHAPKSFTQKVIEGIIFESRWVLVPFYLGLILAQVFYCYKFSVHVVDMVKDFHHMDETAIMFMMLTLIDMTMIANLIKMIISGSYQTFIAPLDYDNLEKVGSGLLKVKMGGSLVGVSSIHLLQAFIHASSLSMREIVVKTIIHIVFLVSTMGMAYVDYLHSSLSKKAYEDIH